jgi:sugar transferase EpsL
VSQTGLPFLVKRSFDVTVAAVGLVVLAPVFVAIALVVRLTLGKPVFFRQVRIGQWCRPFTLVKFRTMVDARDALGQLLPDEDRLRRVGRAMRASTLDELPQLWNVLRGELSLVGPRPLLPEYVPLYSPEQIRRHEVVPGVTGWAQVNGRNALGWADRFRHDVWYVDNWSVMLDVKILIRTISQVLGRSGINAEGHATMPNFQGDVV